MTPLPTFVVIGAQKSATRWLRTNLGKHPDVYTASPRISGMWKSHKKTSNEAPFSCSSAIAAELVLVTS